MTFLASRVWATCDDVTLFGAEVTNRLSGFEALVILFVPSVVVAVIWSGLLLQELCLTLDQGCHLIFQVGEL